MATDSYEYTTFLPLGEISDFNGEEVEGWLSQIEDFFDRYQLDPLQRLAVIHNFMVGEATEWHYEMYLNWRLTTWESFVIDLKNRFSLSNMVNEDAIEVVVPEDSADDAQLLLVESAIENMETAAVVVVDKQSDDDIISDLYHVSVVGESVVVGVTTREVTSNMFAYNRFFLVLKDAEIREWSFKTQFHAINGALPPCLLTICENDPVRLLSVFVSKLAFGGSWCSVNSLKICGLMARPLAKPPDDSSKEVLEYHDGASKGKYRYTIGLGQDCMAFCSEVEDVISLSLTAVPSLLEKYGVDPKQIGGLEVGSEMMIGKSKSIKTFLMQIFEETGNTDTEGVDSTNACYGATAALFNCVNWVESNSWDGRYGLVVCTNSAVYAEGPARPTRGAAAIATLIGPDAPVAFESKLRGSHMAHWRSSKVKWCFIQPLILVPSFTKPPAKPPDDSLKVLSVLNSNQLMTLLSSVVAAEDSDAASRSCVKGNCLLYFIRAHLKVVSILLYTDIAEALKVNVTTRAYLESKNIKLSIYCDSLQRDDYLVSSTLSETVAETAGGGVSEIELACQLGARARILQGSCCIRSFDEAFSDFDFMMKEHKPSQESFIITESLNVMVDGYCAQPKIKKFMETVGEVMAVLISENTTIPITKEKVFSTYSNNQLGMLVYTGEGERPWVRDNKLLNKVTLYRTPPAPRGVPPIKDHFNIDVNGEKHGCFSIHSSPQEPMLLWNGILCDPPTPCVIIGFEQFVDHGGSYLHSAWNPKFGHTANILGIFAHQFMYLSYIDIGIQVKRRLLMEHFSLMRCDSHFEQRHCEADVVTTPILIFTLHGKPRNRNIGGVGGIDALREKIAASTKNGGRALLAIDVSKAFGEMIVVFRFVDENFLTTFCSNLWLKNYGMRQCLSTLADDGFICLFAPSTEILKTKDVAMQAVILRAGKNYEVQDLLLIATLQVSFRSETAGTVNIDEMKKDGPSVGIVDALYKRCSFLGHLALADSVLSSGYVNKIFLFSMPRPPEIDDLEDKVKFKGEGMLRIGILCKLRGLIVFSYNVFSIRIVLGREKRQPMN